LPGGDRIVTDLMIARRLQTAEFQPVERRLAGDRRAVLAARRELAGQHRHHRIVPQFVVVVEVLIAERDAEHPLADQGHHLMLDQVLATYIVCAAKFPTDSRSAPMPTECSWDLLGFATVEGREVV